ncbi:hypothetical protein Tco_0534069 [Tanacetum coccineum]
MGLPFNYSHDPTFFHTVDLYHRNTPPFYRLPFGYELSLVAGIATGALVKGGSRSEVPAQVKGVAYRFSTTKILGVEVFRRQEAAGYRQGAQRDHKAEVFQVSNDDTAVAQRRLEDKQPEEKTNMDCLAKEQEKEYQTGWKIKTGNILDSCNQRNMGFNESGEYKKTFIGSGVGTGSMQVLQGDEFKVEPQEGHTFEGATLCMGTIQYREDSNETAFAVPVVGKIYAHESLTFNNTVACEAISKWKAGLKDDMDARSNVYVLSNGYKKCSDDSDGYYWESTPVGSQEYQMVCMRLDIASADVGMLDNFDRGLETDVQVFVDFNYAMAAYMTLTGAWKMEIWLKGLLAESGYELSLVARIATGALVKGSSRSEVPAQVEGAGYRY